MYEQLFSVFRRTVLLFLAAVAAIAIQGVVAETAWAHSLTVMATASCVNGAAVISYTAISYDQVDFAGENPEIDILFNGVKVDAQPFSLSTTPPNQFSGEKPAPAAASVTVEGVAVGTWDDGFPPGQTNEVTIAVPTQCGGTACPATIGFWKHHPFPPSVEASGLTIAGVIYSPSDLLTILNKAPKGNSVLILGKQLVGALLNLAGGGMDNPLADAAIMDAEALLATNHLNLTSSVVPSSSTLGGKLTTDAFILDGYNSADFGTCSEGSGLNG